MNFIANPPRATSIGEILVDEGRLTPATLRRAENLAAESGEPIVAVLTRLGLIGERELLETISKALAIPVIAASDFPNSPIVIDEISRRFLVHFRVLPISVTDQEIVLAMADPLDAYAREAVAYATEKVVLPRLAAPSDIEDALDRLYSPRALASIEKS